MQWGRSDEELFLNDLEPGSMRPFCFKVNPLSGNKKKLGGPIFVVSPDGRTGLSPRLERIGFTQTGYGIPKGNWPRYMDYADDGIFCVDTESGESSCLVSLDEIPNELRGSLSEIEHEVGRFFLFVVKWSASGERLLAVLRWLPGRGKGDRAVLGAAASRFRSVGRSVSRRLSRRPEKLSGVKPRSKGSPLRSILLTMRRYGSDLHIAVPHHLWSQGGHHPGWCHDDEWLLMNLNYSGDGLRFVKFRYDGSGMQVLSEDIAGSGYPSFHPDGRHILTDAYVSEESEFGDGTTPIRWIDTARGREEKLIRMRTATPHEPGNIALRLDPHPAWDREFRWIAFNGYAEGTHRVYVADLSEYIG